VAAIVYLGLEIAQTHEKDLTQRQEVFEEVRRNGQSIGSAVRDQLEQVTRALNEARTSEKPSRFQQVSPEYRRVIDRYCSRPAPGIATAE